MKKKILVVATVLTLAISLLVLFGCGQSRGNMIRNKNSFDGVIYFSNGNVIPIHSSETTKIYETRDTITIEYKDENGKVKERLVINKDQIIHIRYVEKNIWHTLKKVLF